MRILIVEDNRELSSLISLGLKRAGFACDIADTASDADHLLRATQFDACILDLGLPDANGIVFLNEMRKQGRNLPVLILTARDGIGDRVKGLDSGADDYMLKPFDMEELAARLRALLRRPGQVLGSRLSIANLQLDSSTREVTVDRKTIAMPPRETAVLEPLLRRPGHIVARRAIEDSVYALTEEVSANALEAHISRLRRRLSEAGAQVKVHTLRGIGYMITTDMADEPKA